MDEIKLREIVESTSKKMLDLDVFTKNGVLVNGNSGNKNDLIFYTSHKGYDDFMKKVFKNEK